MKQKIRVIKWNTALKLTLAVSVLMVFFVACGEKENTGTVYDPTQPIELTSFQPDSGRISEMVLLDGSNFGSDPSLIKVYFNSKEAKVINSTGTRILVLVPRLPGDTCTLSVEVDGHKKAYSGYFLYKIAASVTTLAGNGTNALVTTSLDKSQLRPVYIGADKDFNIFVTHENTTLLRINEAENSITVVATNDQGFNHRCPVYTNPVTNILQFGAENERDRFLFCDPKENWTPKMRFILEWDVNGFSLPATIIHYHCLYCEADGCYYTRYNSGEIVRIDPGTWKATVIGMTPSGIAYGMVFHPLDKTVLWMGYDSGAGDVSHSICTFDVTDPGSFTKLSGATNGGFRDGPIEVSQFKQPRQINFDADGNLYVGDSGNHCIRMINTKTMMVETIIGIPGTAGFKDGAKEDALFNTVHGIVIDADGIIYVSDFSNNRVRRIAIE
ncbi:hypothetical protein EZS27_009542 [termite gut metagenome]|uniref:IPT/TIG domain-containing protein n=1 Tax=termite gut metagenome TaxID=433724 RepID=A0A5J4S9B8_9ZZZZ